MGTTTGCTISELGKQYWTKDIRRYGTKRMEDRRNVCEINMLTWRRGKEKGRGRELTIGRSNKMDGKPIRVRGGKEIKIQKG
jgi:hypothetical protein